MAAGNISLMSNISVINWNLEMEIVLIDEVRKRENLWNIKHVYFKVRNLRKHSYEEIVEILRLHSSQDTSALTAGK